MPLDLDQFTKQFDQFKTLIEYNSGGHPFVNFREGLAAVWESYKPRLRDYALQMLAASSWTSDDVGSGEILERTIAAIEIDEPGKNLQNNLVFWQNRFGLANRAHRALLEARTDTDLCVKIEQQLWNLFRSETHEGATFNQLAELAHAKYPLLAYLFFLKDMDRFMPILPSTFDRTFHELNIDLVTQRNCSWENYSHYNETLGQICDALQEIGGIQDPRLIDAQSFCWMLDRLEKPEPGADGTAGRRGPDAGRIFGAREKSVYEMKSSVLNTVKQSRGQAEQRRVKAKELRMTDLQLEALIQELLSRQENRCNLTGLPFQYRGEQEDENMLPSLDRIDSDGHYEIGNLQVVCRFVNFWKQDTDNEEFLRLLALVRGLEE